MSHIKAVLSSLALAKKFPSGEKLIERMKSLCFLNSFSIVSLSMFYKYTILSSDAEAIDLPSGENAIWNICGNCVPGFHYIDENFVYLLLFLSSYETS
jgi:hypothetical protein